MGTNTVYSKRFEDKKALELKENQIKVDNEKTRVT